jgi:hypothetical protein
LVYTNSTNSEYYIATKHKRRGGLVAIACGLWSAFTGACGFATGFASLAIWKKFADGESYMELGDKPVPSAHLLPGMYALTEELISRRRKPPDQYWFTNIGLATPPTKVPQ